MKASARDWSVALAVISVVAGNAFAQTTPDEKPAPSVYDQFPDCMNRGQVAPGDPAPCELPAPPSGRRARAPLGSNVSAPAQGAPANATANATSTASMAGSSPVAGSSRAARGAR